MENIEAKREALDIAQAKLQALIDNPDKGATVAEYRAMLDAAAQAKMQAYTEWRDALTEHTVTRLSGGRPGENYTAQCSCGKRFESTHLTYINRGIKLHLNKHSANPWL